MDATRSRRPRREIIKYGAFYSARSSLEVIKILEDLLNQEARMDQSARQKIESQKRTILEGSQGWDVLYRKYDNEEVKKLGL